ncbi:MAG: hypothetical protein H0X42_13020 [Solirubrobacterales bacterium]|nr:hypothetical protein [Solirubrobacterales bacterium]
MSQRPLTGYDTRDAQTGRRDEELYLYHAPAGAGQGTLVCASCNPTGARPVGIEFKNLDNQIDGDPGLWPAEQGVAASVPGWTTFEPGSGRYQSRYLSDSGRLFFNATDALVPQDSNGTGDVYQYEPPGVGGCLESGPTFSQRSGGCVDLISAGTSADESGFLDASESGNDVFFYTSSKLVTTDTDTARDVYDAHVCSAELPCPPPPPPTPPACAGDACQAPAVPPNDPTPGSLSFSGAGNVKECPKGKKLQKGKCVKQKHKKHHKKKSRKHAKSKRSTAR